MARTPNFKLNKSHTYYKGMSDTVVLEAGTFVRPLEFIYVPEHVKEKWIGFDSITHVFVYTSQGIIPIPKEIIREV